MTPEGKLKQKINVYLRSINAYIFMPVQTGYGSTTLDFLCCIKGKFVGIEAKAKGNFPTPLQKLTMERITKAGGLAFVAWDIERVQKMIEDHILGAYDYDRAD